LRHPYHCEDALHQIVASIQSTAQLEPGKQRPDLLVYPELMLHPAWMRAVAKEAAHNRIGIIIGLHWSQVPTAHRNWRVHTSSQAFILQQRSAGGYSV
jgi:hypothetical protein